MLARASILAPAPAYKDVAGFLGGITWNHPVSIIKDQSFPPLYSGPPQQSHYDDMRAPSSASEGANSAGPAPVIERPDLVGVQNGIAVFLSPQHGLVAVDMRNGTPTVSCSMNLPGAPKNLAHRQRAARLGA